MLSFFRIELEFIARAKPGRSGIFETLSDHAMDCGYSRDRKRKIQPKKNTANKQQLTQDIKILT